VDCVGGCAGGSVEASALGNGTSAVLAVGLSRCKGSRWGCRRLPRPSLWHWWSVWAGARGLRGDVVVCEGRTCGFSGRCDRVRGGLGGGVGVGHGLVVGAVGRAWSERWGLCGCVSVCKLRVCCCIGRCGRVLVGLGGDVGRWQGRLGGVGRRCGRVCWGLGGDVRVVQRQVVRAGGRAGRVCRVSAGVSAFPDGGFAASVAAVGGCAVGCVGLVPLGKGGPVTFAAGAAGGAGRLAEVSALDNGKSAGVAVGLGSCAVSGRGCWRLPRRTLRRWPSVWERVRGAR